MAEKAAEQLTTQPEFDKPLPPVNTSSNGQKYIPASKKTPLKPVKKEIKAHPHPCPVCGATIYGRAMGGHLVACRKRTPEQREKLKQKEKPTPQKTLVDNTIQAATSKQVLCLTDRTVLPVLPPFQDVPPDCRRTWFEIYAELVKEK